MTKLLNRINTLELALVLSLLAALLGFLPHSAALAQDSQTTGAPGYSKSEILEMVESDKKDYPSWCAPATSLQTLEGCSLLPQDATWDELIIMEAFLQEWRATGCCLSTFGYVESGNYAQWIRSYNFPKDSDSCQFLADYAFCGGPIREGDFFYNLFSYIRNEKLSKLAAETLQHLEGLFPATTKFIRLISSDGFEYEEQDALIHLMLRTSLYDRYFKYGQDIDIALYATDVRHIYNSQILEFTILDSRTNNPIPNAHVEVTSQWDSDPKIGISDSNGLVRINLSFDTDHPELYSEGSYSSENCTEDHKTNRVLDVYTYIITTQIHKTIENRSLINLLDRRIQKEQIFLENGNPTDIIRTYKTERRTNCAGNTDADIKAWTDGSLDNDEYYSLN